MVIIDQHAAHERINFERLKNELASNEIRRQSLLFPEVVELDYQQAQTIRKNPEIMRDLGFEIEEFGGNSFRVNATPGLLENLDLKSLISDMADELAEMGRPRLSTKRSTTCFPWSPAIPRSARVSCFPSRKLQALLPRT